MEISAYEDGDAEIRKRGTDQRGGSDGAKVATDDNATQNVVRLKRNVGLISGTSVIVGSIIGSGIFVSPKEVLSETGSVGMSLSVWAAGGLLTLLGALSYAELGTLITKSGGEYPYIWAALGRVVAFMFAWTKIIILTPSSVAICTLTFAEYVISFFEFCGMPQIPPKLIASFAMITLAIINCWDTKLAAQVHVLFTAAKVIALIIIIVGGLVWLGQGNVETLQQGFIGTTNSPSSMALAFYDALWAYEGWNNLNFLTEELRNPYVNLPRANVIGVSLVTVLYVLANISYLVVLGTDGLLNSSAVVVTWGEKVLGKAVIIMPIFVLFSTFGAANGSFFAGVRTLYAAAREEQFPEVLSYVHVKRYTPAPCIMFTAVIGLLMMIPGDIEGLINFFSFAAWLFYALAIVSLIILRVTLRNKHRPIKGSIYCQTNFIRSGFYFRVFILLPLIFLVCSLYLVVAPIIQDPRLEFLYAFLFIVGGLVLYIPLVHFKLHKGCFDPVTMFLQLLMEVAPSPYVPDVD